MILKLCLNPTVVSEDGIFTACHVDSAYNEDLKENSYDQVCGDVCQVNEMLCDNVSIIFS